MNLDSRTQSISGNIVTIECYNIKNKDFLENEEDVKQGLRVALEKAGATVYDVYSHKFGPGVTAVAIIGESHGALHTYPELAYARLTMDCYSHMNPDITINYLQELLQTTERPIVRSISIGLKS